MYKVFIDKNKCKSCKLCIKVCPKNKLKLSKEINSSGFNPVEPKEDVECIGCGFCFLVCPDWCIEIYEE